MKKNETNLDAVKLMRSIRDDLSRQVSGMTVEEEKDFIRKQLCAAQTPKGKPVNVKARAS
jgi:hypothetical protein